MKNITIIISTFILTTAIGLIGFYWRRNGRQTQLKSLETDWIKFESAVAIGNIETINSYGLKLVYNVNLKINQLKIMSDTINLLIEAHPQLEELKLAILNKKLHYGRQLQW